MSRASDVPQPDLACPGTRGERLAVRRELHRLHVPARRGNGQRSAKRSGVCRVAHVPQPDRAVRAARGERIAVRAEGRQSRSCWPARSACRVRVAVPGPTPSHRLTTRPAPAAARISPSGLNAVTYSGSSVLAATRLSTREGWPGDADVPQPQRPVGACRREQLVVRAQRAPLHDARGVEDGGRPTGPPRIRARWLSRARCGPGCSPTRSAARRATAPGHGSDPPRARPHQRWLVAVR